MRICQSHWIELRDKYEADFKLIAASLCANYLLLDSEILAQVFHSLENLQAAVEQEGGCMLCFYHTHLEKDPILALDERMKKIPKLEMATLQAQDAQAREHGKK